MGARIAINASIVGGNPTGLGIYSINLVRALDRIRDDFVVYSSSPDAFPGLCAPIRRVPAAVRPGFGMRGHLARILWLQSVLRAEVRRAGFRALVNTVPEGITGPAIPQLTIVHDLLPLRFPPEYPRQQYYFRHFVPRILRTSRVVVADSQFTCRDVIEHYGFPSTKIRVIYPGYEPAVFSCNGDGPSPGQSEPPYFLYVGNLLPHKNLLRLLDATAMVRRRRPCRLVIRGEGRRAHVRALRERIETLGLENMVTFFGYVNERFLRDLYADATCLVLPSLGEGFGLTVLEAMACGTPVVTASGSSMPEVAGDAALMVDPYDAVSLAEAMYRVLTDEGLQSRLRQRGLERARSFSWRSTAEAISTLLDEEFDRVGDVISRSAAAAPPTGWGQRRRGGARAAAGRPSELNAR